MPNVVQCVLGAAKAVAFKGDAATACGQVCAVIRALLHSHSEAKGCSERSGALAAVRHGLTRALWLRAQSPFANLTLGALFFAVVHEKRRPDLGAFDAAVARGGEHAGLMRQYKALMQRCWSQDPAERPNFLKVSALACLEMTVHLVGEGAGKRGSSAARSRDTAGARTSGGAATC